MCQSSPSWRLLALLACLVLQPLAAGAQVVRGVVLEDGTDAPIAGAHVRLSSVEGEVAGTADSDSTGTFAMRLRRAGTYVVHLTHIGYSFAESDTLTVRGGETVEVRLRMASQAIPIEPLVVTGRRHARLAGFYERSERGGFGRFITRAEIDAHPSHRTSDLLRRMPGVDVVTTAFPSTNLVTMRGGMGRCMPTLYIDGMEVRQYRESGIDELISAAMLEGVEVYTSFASAPSPIHARGACGVIAFWTRPAEGRSWSWRRLLAGVGLFSALVLLAR